MKNISDKIQTAKQIIQNSKNIVAFTGAGISTESGIPDFRSPGGLWERFDPMKYANYKVFLKQPQYYWELEREITKLVEKSEPNPAHFALVKLEKIGKLKAIITQNIDMLHQKAGNKIPIYELHGSAYSGKCLKCGEKLTRTQLLHKMNTETIPRCEKCKGLVKPNVVLFEEKLPPEAYDGAMNALNDADCFIVIGSSLLVSPANYFPYVASESGIKMIFINRDPTFLDEFAEVVLQGNAGEILPELVVP